MPLQCREQMRSMESQYRAPYRRVGMKNRPCAGDIGNTAVIGRCLRKRTARDVGKCL